MSKVTVAFTVVTVSEKVRLMSITSPVVYEPSALVEVMLVMVGRTLSIPKALEVTQAPASTMPSFGLIQRYTALSSVVGRSVALSQIKL